MSRPLACALRFPVEVINMVDYGRMNAAGIIDHCVSVMG